jgi:hypothetical protein
MRENRPYGSEGGEANAFPTPIGRVQIEAHVGAGFKPALAQQTQTEALARTFASRMILDGRMDDPESISIVVHAARGRV